VVRRADDEAVRAVPGGKVFEGSPHIASPWMCVLGTRQYRRGNPPLQSHIQRFARRFSK
jgi:hypothetical protein